MSLFVNLLQAASPSSHSHLLSELEPEDGVELEDSLDHNGVPRLGMRSADVEVRAYIYISL